MLVAHTATAAACPSCRDLSISRKHAQLFVAKYTPEEAKRGDVPRLFLHDVGSTAGSFVNGVQIPAKKDVELHEGDQVQFGSKEHKHYTFRYGRVRLACSRLRDEERQLLLSYCKRLGIAVVNEIDETVTHVVVNRASATAKVMQALVLAIPLVTLDFVGAYAAWNGLGDHAEPHATQFYAKGEPLVQGAFYEPDSRRKTLLANLAVVAFGKQPTVAQLATLMGGTVVVVKTLDEWAELTSTIRQRVGARALTILLQPGDDSLPRGMREIIDGLASKGELTNEKAVNLALLTATLQPHLTPVSLDELLTLTGGRRESEKTDSQNVDGSDPGSLPADASLSISALAGADEPASARTSPPIRSAGRSRRNVVAEDVDEDEDEDEFARPSINDVLRRTPAASKKRKPAPSPAKDVVPPSPAKPIVATNLVVASSPATKTPVKKRRVETAATASPAAPRPAVRTVVAQPPRRLIDVAPEDAAGVREEELAAGRVLFKSLVRREHRERGTKIFVKHEHAPRAATVATKVV